MVASNLSNPGVSADYLTLDGACYAAFCGPSIFLPFTPAAEVFISADYREA